MLISHFHHKQNKLSLNDERETGENVTKNIFFSFPFHFLQKFTHSHKFIYYYFRFFFPSSSMWHDKNECEREYEIKEEEKVGVDSHKIHISFIPILFFWIVADITKQ